MSNQINPGLNVAEDFFKTVAWDTAINAALTYYLGEAMVIPVLGPIIRDVVLLVTDKAFEFFRKMFDCAALPILNADRKAKLEPLAVQAKLIGYSKGINSPEYQKAKEDARQKWIAYNIVNA